MKTRLVPLLLALALLFTGCAGASERRRTGEPYSLYFLAPEGAAQGRDAIQSSVEYLDLPEDATLTEKASAVVARLMAGPEEGALISPIPATVQLNSLTVSDRLVRVDFSDRFTQLGGVDLLLADYCLTLSLTALEGISAVSVTAQGRVPAQQPKRVFYERDVLLSTMDDVVQTVDVTLYFLDENGALAGEKRTLELYEGQSQTENLVAALLSGPVSRELTALFPPEVLVNSVRMENGVCSVNFSAASLAFLPPDEGRQSLILWSLCESVFSLDAVRELRLLSDGKPLEAFGAIPVGETLTRAQG